MSLSLALLLPAVIVLAGLLERVWPLRKLAARSLALTWRGRNAPRMDRTARITPLPAAA